MVLHTTDVLRVPYSCGVVLVFLVVAGNSFWVLCTYLLYRTVVWRESKFCTNFCVESKLSFPPQQKNYTTTQLYCTLSTYVTPKTIYCQNQKTKPISRQNQKLTQQHNWKKGSSSPREAWEGSSSPCKASVFVPPSVFPSVSKG